MGLGRRVLRGGRALAIGVALPLLAAAAAGAAAGGAVAKAPQRTASSQAAAKGRSKPPFDPQSVLVRFRADVAHEERAAIVTRSGGHLAPQIEGTSFSLVRATRTTGADLTARLERDARVQTVVPNFIRHAFDDPNDAPYWEHEATSVDLVRLPQAWGITHGTSSTKIAIVDTGVDLDHPDLALRILPGKDFVNGDDSADDDVWHGTMVASVAAATPNN